MPVTPDPASSALALYVGASDSDELFVSDCYAEARALVDQMIGSNVAAVPAEIRTRGILEAGSELFHRRQAPNGIAQFAAVDGSAIRVARDPMVAARAILVPFLPIGFA